MNLINFNSRSSADSRAKETLDVDKKMNILVIDDDDDDGMIYY